jgi:glycosyltransferase involved in cell wall biosynthesis
MRICIIGKFPPIQGGVSVRTYWSAHDLAARGHEVHVVTNAKEARPPFRMHMRRQDWKRCEIAAGGGMPQRDASGGSVKVHWTDPVDNSQLHIPMASPFVTKLAATAARIHSERPFDVIYSHYLEPYGVAGHLAAEIAGVPHVVRMAGSDSGRLWRHPQFEALYDHVLRSAAAVVATGMIAGRAIKHGVRPERIVAGGILEVPEDLFCPDGPVLDPAALRQEIESEPEVREMLWGSFAGKTPYFGIYGKLGDSKGSFALLAAMQQLKQRGLDVGLVAMAHGWPTLESKFRARAEELGIVDRVLQIPFLPHWRVPEFLRSCLAVCCLEQDFPIAAHTPIVAREVLTCGACLIGSTEVIRKLPNYSRVPDGYGCVAIDDVQDVDALSARLAAIASDPEPIASVASRGRAFARKAQAEAHDPARLERLLKSVVGKRASFRRRRPAADAPTEIADPRFPITRLAAQALTAKPEPRAAHAASEAQDGPVDLRQAREVLAAAERAIAQGQSSLRSVASAIKLEIAIAEAEDAGFSGDQSERIDPIFRLRTRRWAMVEGDLPGLVPVRDPELRMMTFDVSELVEPQARPKRDAALSPRPRHVVAFASANGERKEPLFVSDGTARILEFSDGTRTALEIANEVGAGNGRGPGRKGIEQIEELFRSGLLTLQESKLVRASCLPPRQPADSAPPIPGNDRRPAGGGWAAAE